jgi:MFS family permease
MMWLVILGLGAIFFFLEAGAIISWVLILVYTLLVVCGAFYGPAWSSWMKDLVPPGQRGKYFGQRNQIYGFVVLISMLGAGSILTHFRTEHIFFGFSILFVTAFAARLISALLLAKQYEPELHSEPGYYFGFWQFLRKAPKNNFGRFAIYVALMNLTTAIASPFFAVYMLRDLKFSYLFYTLVLISSSLASILFMPALGRFADRYGNLITVKVMGFLVPLVPLLWFASPLITTFKSAALLPYLVGVEFFSGLAWAGFTLSSSNFIYDAVTRQRMGLCVAYSNVANGIGVFIGAMLGGLLALRPLLFVFLLSGLARLTVSLAMLPKIKEVRGVEDLRLNGVSEVLLPAEWLKYLVRFIPGRRRPGAF